MGLKNCEYLLSRSLPFAIFACNRLYQPLTGEDGKDLKFNSLVGALNYMSLQGWEFVDTKSVTEGAGGLTDTKVFYIFSKEVPDEELEQAVKESYKND